MTRTSFPSKMLALTFVAAGLLFTACEPYQFQALKGTITTEAKNAADVLPADVMYVAMMNTQDLKNNEYTDLFGDNGIVFSNVESDDLAQLQDFMNATGFDPNDDLREMYVAVSPRSQSQPTFSMVAYASNDPAELQAYLENNAGDDLNKRNYKGIDVFEAEDGTKPSLSFVNEEMIIAAANPGLLEDMIDRLQGDGTQALASNEKMTELMTQASIGGSGWFVAKKPEINTNMRSGGNEIEQSAQQIWNTLDYVVGAVNIESTGFDSQMFFYPNEGVDAKDMASLMNGMIAVAKVQPEIQQEFVEVLDDMRAKASGDYVEMDLFIENNMIQTVSDR